MNIKTINLTGGEISVKVGGGNSEIKNNGAATIYASAASGIVAGADGVVSIPAGASVTVTDTRGTVYILGTGSAEVVGKDFVAPVFKSAATSGGGSTEDEVARNAINAHAADTDIHHSTDDITGMISHPNLLINPDFRINQRKVSGTLTDLGYFVDRWKLVSGTVTVNSNGTLTLNGSISQTLENAAGTDVTASSSAGTAVYDNSTKTFTLTANGETISWTKLEVGGIATRFSPPDTATELAKCQRYLWVLKGSSLRLGVTNAYSENYAVLYFYAPQAFRSVPAVSFENLALGLRSNGNVIKNIDSIRIGCTSNTIKMYANFASDSLLTVGEWYELCNQPGTTGALIFNAEI